MGEKLKLIDLFSGAGGMSLGFANAGEDVKFQPIFALDFNRDAVETYSLNFGSHAVEADIENFLNTQAIPKADIVIGGPPCQGFSLLNRNRKGDKRRSLWKPFLDAVEKSEASVFVIENVRELKNSPEYDQITRYADELGFAVWSDVLNAADYGVPQIRKRTFIVGWKKEVYTGFDPPKKTHGPDAGTPYKTVRDAIGDLGEPVKWEERPQTPPYNLHFRRNPTPLSVERYRHVPPGGNRFDLQRNAPHLTPKCWIKKKSGGTDLFGRLWWDRPSVTIRTEFFKPEKGRYLHPEAHRPITHREAARLMGFPDDFVFVGSKTEIAKQIGNAVPPPLAKAVAEAVLKMMLEKRAEKAA